MPAFVVGERVGPVEVFKHFDGTGDGDAVAYAVLEVVEYGFLQDVGILCVDVVGTFQHV